MKKVHVLDRFALVSFFHKEPGWQKVNAILYELASSGGKAVLNIINWGEFYYIVKRRVGTRMSEEALGLLEQLPIEILAVDTVLVKHAAEIKSEYPVSYAGAFCIGTAQELNGQILTNDKEFRVVQHLVPVIWLTSR